MKYYRKKNQYQFVSFSKISLKPLLLMIAMFFLVHSTLLFAEVTASTNRTVLTIDETITLEIKSKNASGEPELNELENDFQILGRSQSQNYSLINGHASRTHTWTITLLPKRTGEIIIPAIKVGNEQTKAIHLVVQKQSSTPGLDGKDVFLKIEVSDNEGKDFYVQQQIIVKIQLFHRIRFTNATLSDLELNNTVIEKLGNDSNYSKVIANHRYNVIEQNYAIYPQQSGPLTIPELTFSGNAEISQNFSLFSRPGQRIISRTKPISLNILPVPDNYTGKIWLPAESLELEATILEDINNITAGEAITRHIIVRSTGLLGSQLPANTISSSSSIKAYPDKEQLNTQLVNGKVIGIRRDTIAIIPLKSGAFTLPEINIDWWNTKTNQQETTTLPAQTLFALLNAEQANTDSENMSTQTSESADKSTSKNTVEKTVEKVIYKPTHLTKNIWFWISLALLILWFMTIAILLISRSKHKSKATNLSKPISDDHEKHLQALFDACNENDAHKTTLALIQWAKIYFKQPLLSGVTQIIEKIDDVNLIESINLLESVQYSGNKQDWKGDSLSSSLHDFIKEQKKQGETIRKSHSNAFVSLNP